MRILAAAAATVALAGAVSQAVAGGTVYVPTGSAGEVLIIDAERDAIAGRIPGIADAHGLAKVPGAAMLVAGMYAEFSPDQPGLPPKPEGMSEADHLAHHAAPNGEAKMDHRLVGYLSLIEAEGGAVIRRIAVPGAVHHTAVTPDGRHAVATHPNGGGVSITDLSRFAVIATVETGPMPNYAVVARDGSRVYVSNAGNDTISEIETAGWTVQRTFAVGEGPEHIVLAPDDGTLYVANAGEGTVSAVSLARGEAVATYRIGGALHGIDLADDGETLFVSAMERDQLVAIDLRTGEIERAALSPAPYHLAAVSGTGKLYVASAGEAVIWVVDQESLETLGAIPVHGKAHQMVVVAN